jgi:hypothetical protein
MDGTQEHTPGAKAPFPFAPKRPEAEALGYLEASTTAKAGTTAKQERQQKRNAGILPHSTSLRARMTKFLSLNGRCKRLR